MLLTYDVSSYYLILNRMKGKFFRTSVFHCQVSIKMSSWVPVTRAWNYRTEMYERWHYTFLRSSPWLREVVKTIYVQSARCKFHITVWAYFYNLCSPLPHPLKWVGKTNTFALENKYHTEASKVFSIPPFLLPLVNVPMFTRKIKGDLLFPPIFHVR